jgi:hypothetical protein
MILFVLSPCGARLKLAVCYHDIKGASYQGSFFRLHVARKHQKYFLTKKGIKIQEIFWMKKPNVNHEL